MAVCGSYTLAALVAELRERAVAREPQESLMGWLASLVKGLGIKMRTDKFYFLILGACRRKVGVGRFLW